MQKARHNWARSWGSFEIMGFFWQSVVMEMLSLECYYLSLFIYVPFHSSEHH